MSVDQPKCGTIKDDGTPCRSWVACERCEKCWSHCDHREEERREAQRRGAATTNSRAREGEGLAPSELPPLDSHEAAETWTDAIGRAAATGRLSASAAQAALRAVREWRESRDAGQVSERLEALTDALAEWRKTGDPEPVLELVDGDG